MQLQPRRDVDLSHENICRFMAHLVQWSDSQVQSLSHIVFRPTFHTPAQRRGDRKRLMERLEEADRLAGRLSTLILTEDDHEAADRLIRAVFNGYSVIQCRLPSCGKFAVDARRRKTRGMPKLYCSPEHAKVAANAAMVLRRSEERRQRREQAAEDQAARHTKESEQKST